MAYPPRGFIGLMGPDEVVTRVLKVLDRVDLSKTDRFYHRMVMSCPGKACVYLD